MPTMFKYRNSIEIILKYSHRFEFNICVCTAIFIYLFSDTPKYRDLQVFYIIIHINHFKKATMVTVE